MSITAAQVAHGQRCCPPCAEAPYSGPSMELVLVRTAPGAPIVASAAVEGHGGAIAVRNDGSLTYISASGNVYNAPEESLPTDITSLAAVATSEASLTIFVFVSGAQPGFRSCAHPLSKWPSLSSPRKRWCQHRRYVLGRGRAGGRTVGRSPHSGAQRGPQRIITVTGLNGILQLYCHSPQRER
jgi:hypothetical protein